MTPLDPCEFWLDGTVKQHLGTRVQTRTCEGLLYRSCIDQICEYSYQLNLLLLLVPCYTRRMDAYWVPNTHTQENWICVADVHRKEGRETRHRFTTVWFFFAWPWKTNADPRLVPLCCNRVTCDFRIGNHSVIFMLTFSNCLGCPILWWRISSTGSFCTTGQIYSSSPQPLKIAIKLNIWLSTTEKWNGRTHWRKWG